MPSFGPPCERSVLFISSIGQQAYGVHTSGIASAPRVYEPRVSVAAIVPGIVSVRATSSIVVLASHRLCFIASLILPPSSLNEAGFLKGSLKECALKHSLH
jgi:hypothetical protein